MPLISLSFLDVYGVDACVYVCLAVVVAVFVGVCGVCINVWVLVCMCV